MNTFSSDKRKAESSSNISRIIRLSASDSGIDHHKVIYRKMPEKGLRVAKTDIGKTRYTDSDF